MVEGFEPLLWLIHGVRSHEDVKVSAYQGSKLLDQKVVRADGLVLRMLPLILGRVDCSALQFCDPIFLWSGRTYNEKCKPVLESNWLCRILEAQASDACCVERGVRPSTIDVAAHIDGFTLLLSFWNSMPVASDAIANALSIVISMLDAYAAVGGRFLHDPGLREVFPDDGLCQ